MKRDIKKLAEEMRTPKLQDIRAVNNITDQGDREVSLISNLTGLSEEELNKIDYPEYLLLQEKLRTFMYPAGQSA